MTRIHKVVLTYVLYNATAILGIICAVFELSLSWRILTMILVAASIIGVLKLSHCPQCGRYGLPISPFKQRDPHCKYCMKSPE